MTAASTGQPAFKPGDVVTIADGDYPLTWTVLCITDHTQLDLSLPHVNNAIALLESGTTGRKRHEPVRNLTFFTGRNTQ
jgi:hypothetical protein